MTELNGEGPILHMHFGITVKFLFQYENQCSSFIQNESWGRKTYSWPIEFDISFLMLEVIILQLGWRFVSFLNTRLFAFLCEELRKSWTFWNILWKLPIKNRCKLFSFWSSKRTASDTSVLQIICTVLYMISLSHFLAMVRKIYMSYFPPNNWSSVRSHFLEASPPFIWPPHQGGIESIYCQFKPLPPYKSLLGQVVDV